MTYRKHNVEKVVWEQVISRHFEFPSNWIHGADWSLCHVPTEGYSACIGCLVLVESII
jgi:hypothetical protein